jgi:hypothetical protein
MLRSCGTGGERRQFQEIASLHGACVPAWAMDCGSAPVYTVSRM